MRNTTLSRTVCVLVCVATPVQAVAQYCADPTANPCMQARMQGPSNAYMISVYGRAECDDEIINAAAAWNGAGSQFNLQDYSYYGQEFLVKGTNGVQIVFNTAAQMGRTDNAVTYYGDSVAGWRRDDGVNIPVVNDADIVVNSDKIAANTIECSATNYTDRYDLKRTMAHEFGHVVGLNHNTNLACATYQVGQKKPFSTLCDPEKSAAVTLYSR